jgi:DNA-binding CsgD family transcriptional regulator
MKSLVFEYETGKWRLDGLSHLQVHIPLNPLSKKLEYTLDAFSIGDYGYAILDENLRFIRQSTKLKKVLGFDLETISFSNLIGKVPTKHRGTIQEYQDQAVSQLKEKFASSHQLLKIRFDYPYLHPSRGYRRIVQQMVPLELKGNSILSYLVIFTDISYLKRSGECGYSEISMVDWVEKVNEAPIATIHAGFNPFTKRELEVLKCMKMGLRTEEIANKLCLSIGTVYNHKKRMYKKVKVKSASELLSMAIQNRWE